MSANKFLSNPPTITPSRVLNNLFWLLLFVACWWIFSQFSYSSGSDWERFYSNPANILLYPPWTEWFLIPLRWSGGRPVVMAITVLLVAFFTWGRAEGSPSRNLFPTVAVLASFPMIVALSQGTVDALPALGLALYPWSAPLALFKPQVVGWALLARGRSLLFAIGWGLLSLVIWGWWPGKIVRTAVDLNPLYNISIWQLSWPLGLVCLGLFVLTMCKHRDPDQLMCCGALLFPYMLPNHYLPLLPAFARLKAWQTTVVWLAGWLPVLLSPTLANWRQLGVITPLLLWMFLNYSTNRGFVRQAPGFSQKRSYWAYALIPPEYPVENLKNVTVLVENKGAFRRWVPAKFWERSLYRLDQFYDRILRICAFRN